VEAEHNQHHADQHNLLSGTLLVKVGKQDKSIWRRPSAALATVLPELKR